MSSSFLAPPRRSREDLHRDLKNALIFFLVPIPAVLAWWLLVRLCDPAGACSTGAPAWFCRLGLEHPIGFVNALFFANVCVLFWLISVVQRSSWLIDPYWTILPLFIAHFYAAHPLASADPTRSWLALGLLWVWSTRLTVNYFRRERWRFGVREDWRYAKMRAEQPHFWWSSFFPVYLLQQGLLVGLTLPFWAIHVHPRGFDAVDLIIAAFALAGIVIAHLADTQLHAFVRENLAREQRDEARIEVLDRGIWGWSRHPNYFGEQLFWWAIAAWGLRLGEGWVVIGTLANTVILAVVTVLTERRILERADRREAYRAYQVRTSVWLPWPPRRR